MCRQKLSHRSITRTCPEPLANFAAISNTHWFTELSAQVGEPLTVGDRRKSGLSAAVRTEFEIQVPTKIVTSSDFWQIVEIRDHGAVAGATVFVPRSRHWFRRPLLISFDIGWWTGYLFLIFWALMGLSSVLCWLPFKNQDSVMVRWGEKYVMFVNSVLNFHQDLQFVNSFNLEPYVRFVNNVYLLDCGFSYTRILW